MFILNFSTLLQFYRAHISMYHSVGNCVFSFLEAMLTFEQQHIADASEALKLCLSVCNRHRKKNTITESIGKTFKRVSKCVKCIKFRMSTMLGMSVVRNPL